MAATLHYEIPKEPGGGKGLLCAVLVHLLLLVFLWIGVSWQSDHSEGVEAEVWNIKFQDAGPKPVKSLPPPPKKVVDKPVMKPKIAKPDIALAQKKKRELALKKKREAEKRRKKLKAKKQREAQAQLDRQWEEQMHRNKAAVGSGGSGTAAKSSGRLSDAYAAKIRTKIRSNTVFTVPPGLYGNPDVQYAIELLPDGTLRNPPRKLKASGIPGFDQAVARAITKSVPFPRDKSGKVPPELIIKHKPKD